MKSNNNYQVVGLSKKNHMNFPRGHGLKKRHTRTSVLGRAVGPAFQGHPRQRMEQCFCEILLSLVLDFLLRRELRLPPPDKDVVGANLHEQDGNSNAKFMEDQRCNTHRSVLGELEGKENN